MAFQKWEECFEIIYMKATPEGMYDKLLPYTCMKSLVHWVEDRSP